MRPAGAILRDLLRQTRVIEPDLVAEVFATAREFWPSIGEEEVSVGDFRRGVLHVVLNSHARMAEAKSFLCDSFRESLNRRIGEDRYVSKLVFHVRGTY